MWLIFVSYSSSYCFFFLFLLQSLDNLILQIFGKTCAIAINPLQFICVSNTSENSSGSPFQDYTILLSIGLVVRFYVCLSLPFVYINITTIVIVIVTIVWECSRQFLLLLLLKTKFS